ncbi:DUF4132 domain-containing protein [Pseudonocardia sp. TRM90224]|uniref:DUF4132 domain-containing protein n=1 Tax=Pseudonocardia sp. TRM90224 TaxID=2812678 RepID=UPI00272E6AC6|nr:DUF4132 domain-containing protein [Pseudonocardia sp. TRM90224]
MPVDKNVLPRRGDVGSPYVPAPGAPAKLHAVLRAKESEIRAMLSSPNSDPELLIAAEEHLAGRPNPLGAAAVVQATGYRDDYDDIAAGWIGEHGLAFTAAAAIALSTIVFTHIGGVGLRRLPADGLPSVWGRAHQVPPVVREALAFTDDSGYAEAVAAVGPLRTTPANRAMAAFLFPTETGWVDDACADAVAHGEVSAHALLLLCAIGTAEQLEHVYRIVEPHWIDYNPAMLATLAHQVGPAIVPAIGEWLPRFRADGARRALDILVGLDTDDAFAVIIDAARTPAGVLALGRAAMRSPRRAIRMLSGAVAADPRTEQLSLRLRGLVRTFPAIVTDLLPELPEQSRAVVEGIRASGPQVPDAPVGSLPRVLADPPWLRKGRTKPIVVADLFAPRVEQLRWAPGEEDEFRKPPYWWCDHHLNHDWAFAVEQVRLGVPTGHEPFRILSAAPVELLRPILPTWRPVSSWRAHDSETRFAAAKLGLDVLPILVAEAAKHPKISGATLLPFLSNGVAELMADWLGRLRTVRSTATAYFERHGVDAARLVVPAALDKPGPQRHSAEAALRVVAARHGADAVLAVAAEYGSAAADGVSRVLATDAIDVVPAKPPTIGEWLDVAALPQLLLTGRETAVPAEAMPHVVTTLALGKPGAPYAGAEQLGETCDPASLAEVGRTLFQLWKNAGMPPKDGWALTSLGTTGDDATARMLAPLIAVWPGEAGHSRAVTGLGVLAGIGTEGALMQLEKIARRSKFSALKKRAQEKITEVAGLLGLTAEQLADRLVPDLGLDPDGTMTLDYGPRSFTVGFDEQLKPFVTDSAGKHLKALPKPGAKDDPTLAPEAYKRFATLKKDARGVATDQVGRLEAAMVDGRRWSGRELTDLFAHHPLVAHLARRLVWARFEDGAVAATFRIAEDGTLADPDDKTFEIADDAEIGIPHPLHIAGELESWSETFADYAILQPFPQLGRAAFVIGADELAAELRRFKGIKVPTGKVHALIRGGWERGEPQDGGVVVEITKPLGAGRKATLDISGFAIGAADVFPEQEILGVQVKGAAELDAITLSELLADLTALAD